MKNEDYFDYIKDFHLGSMIKEIAGQQKIAASKIMEVLNPPRYQKNVDKIFKIKDMDIDDVIRISRLLEHKLLEMISYKYLSHLPFSGIYLGQTYDSITLCLKTNSFKISRKEDIFNFLENFHIGDYIKIIAQQKGLYEKELAAMIGWKPASVSYYFKHKSMKINPLIHFSKALQYNFIAEIYLVRASIHPFNDCTIKLSTHQNQSVNQDEGIFSMVFSSKNQNK